MVKMKINGLRFPVYCSSNMMQRGWLGGQWVKMVGPNIVDFANASNYMGFMLLGYKKKDIGDYVPYQHENVAVTSHPHPATMINASGYFDFSSTVIEPDVWAENQEIYISNNGFLTNVNLGFTLMGRVIAAPQNNGGWLGCGFGMI